MRGGIVGAEYGRLPRMGDDEPNGLLYDLLYDRYLHEYSLWGME